MFKSLIILIMMFFALSACVTQNIRISSPVNIFVIDAKADMEKIRRDLLPILKSLPEGGYFNVIIVGTELRPWRQYPVEVNPGNKTTAALTVENIEQGGSLDFINAINDDIPDMILRDFDETHFDNVELFLFTDGRKNSNGNAESQLIAKLVKLNEIINIRIQAIIYDSDIPEFYKELTSTITGRLIIKN